MPKKSIQRGCASKSKRRSLKKTRNQKRGGNPMYAQNMMTVDPQRMMLTSQTPASFSGGRKHHSRKYYKRGGSLAYSLINHANTTISNAATTATNTINSQLTGSAPQFANTPVAMV
jgi:hypothetical protein